MAKFKITGPDGRQYNVEAPEDASNDDLIAYVQNNYKSAPPTPGAATSLGDYERKQATLNPRHAGLSEVEKADYELSKKLGTSSGRRLELGATFGGADEFAALGNTVVEPLLGLVGKDPRRGMGFSDRFQSHMRVQKALNDDARDTESAIGEFLGGIGAAAPAAGVAAAGQAGKMAIGGWEAAKQFGREFMTPKNLATTAGVGGLFGATHAALDTDGSVSDRASAVPSGAMYGGIGAVGLGAGLGAFLSAKAGRRVAKDLKAEEAAKARAADLSEWQAAGVTPFGPELSSSHIVKGSAPGLASGWFGGDLRQSAGRSIEDVTRQARKTLNDATDGRSSADMGEAIQESLRRNLRGYSKGDAELAAMNNHELESITGPVAADGFSLPKKIATPVEPRFVGPVPPNYSKYNHADEHIPGMKVEANYNTLDDIAPDPRYVSRAEAAKAMASNIDQQYAQLHKEYMDTWQAILTARRNAINDLKNDDTAAVAQGGRLIGSRRDVFGKIHYVDEYDKAVPNIERRKYMKDMWHEDADAALSPKHADVLGPLYTKHKILHDRGLRLLSEARAAKESAQEWSTHIADDRSARWKDSIASERARAERVYQERYEAAQKDAARLRAERDAEMETERLKKQESVRAEEMTRARQKEMDDQWARDVASGSSFRLGSSRETYPTEASAAYTRLERELPGERFNPLGKLGFEPGYKTKTAELLDDLLDDARGALHVRGGGPALGDTGGVRDDLISYVRQRGGQEAASILSRLSDANTRGQGVSVFGLRNMRTEIGRAIEGARDSGADTSLLRRLYKAITDDLYTATSRQGHPPSATTADGRRYDIDAAGDARPVGEKSPQSVVYVKPEHAKLLRGGTDVPETGAEMGFHPMRRYAVHTDGSGNKSIALFRGEGDGVVDGSTKVPFRTKPEKGLLPVELHDDGSRVKIGSAITDVLPSSGQRAANMMRNIDSQYEEMVSTLRKPLSKIYGQNTSPIAAMDKLSKAATDGDVHTVRSFMRVMTEKDEPLRGAAAIVNHVTNGAASLDDFVNGLNKIPSEVKRVMFSTSEARKWYDNIERLHGLGNRLSKYKTAVDRGGGIDLSTRTNQMAIASSLAGLPTLIGYAAGATAAAKFLASPKYVDMLTRAVRAGSSPGNIGEFSSSVRRLAYVAAQDGEFGAQVLDALKASRANAMIVGVNASGADKAALERAKEMQKDGMGRDAIWKKTGWFVDGDGNWKTEIDDSNSGFTETFWRAVQDNAVDGKTRSSKMGDFYSHPPLYEAYPRLKEMETLVGPMPKGFKNARGLFSGDTIWLNDDEDFLADESIALHEMQHAVQSEEGFDYGRRASNPLANMGSYYRLPGEAEAFNVGRRRTMSAEERWAIPPWETLDVDEKDLLYSRKTRRKSEKRKP